MFVSSFNTTAAAAAAAGVCACVSPGGPWVPELKVSPQSQGGGRKRLWDPDESHGGCVLFFCLFLGSTLFYSLTVLSIN